MEKPNAHKNVTEPIVSNYYPPEARGWAMSTGFQKLVRWSGTPPQYREIETESEFARSIGVSLETIETWKSHCAFSSLVSESTRDWIKERTPEAIGALYKRIIEENGDGRDIEFFIRLIWPFER